MTLATAGTAVTVKSEKKMLSDTDDVWLLAVPVTVKVVGFELLAESFVTVTILVSPALMEEGLKEQVTLLEQAREMLELNVDGAEAPMVKVVDVVPITRLVEALEAESVKREPPLPVKETDGLPEPFDVIEKEPVWLPPDVGSK
jgi:hypothetical protein